MLPNLTDILYSFGTQCVTIPRFHTIGMETIILFLHLQYIIIKLCEPYGVWSSTCGPAPICP